MWLRIWWMKQCELISNCNYLKFERFISVLVASTIVSTLVLFMASQFIYFLWNLIKNNIGSQYAYYTDFL